MPGKIKTVIFDMGNVLVPLNMEKMYQAFEKLGVENVRSKFKKPAVQQIYDDYECGNAFMTSPVFRKEMRRELGIPSSISDDEFDAAWNAMLCPENPKFNKRIEIIRDLKKQGYKIYLLSNCNEIHLKFLQSHYKKLFDELFDKQFFSCYMGLKKPALAIYERVLKEINEEFAIFFDDKAENIYASRKAKMFGFVLDTEAPAIRILTAIDSIPSNIPQRVTFRGQKTLPVEQKPAGSLGLHSKL